MPALPLSADIREFCEFKRIASSVLYSRPNIAPFAPESQISSRATLLFALVTRRLIFGRDKSREEKYFDVDGRENARGVLDSLSPIEAEGDGLD